jgi:hypothetical protein
VITLLSGLDGSGEIVEIGEVLVSTARSLVCFKIGENAVVVERLEEVAEVGAQ